MTRPLLLLLRHYHAAMELRHIRAAARHEERRRMVLKRLAQADMPPVYKPMRLRKWLRILWEG